MYLVDFSGKISCYRLIGTAPELAHVDLVLLEVDPEELGIADEFRDLDSHISKFRKREIFIVLPLPVHPVQGYTGIGLYAVIDLFHDTIMQDVSSSIYPFRREKWGKIAITAPGILFCCLRQSPAG